jgi:integrase
MIRAQAFRSMKSRIEVLEIVRAKIRLRHFALSTEDAYCHWVGRYYDFCVERSRGITPEERAEAFLTYLARRFLSAKTQNQALCALVFLYREVLKKPLGAIDALRAKRPAVERTAPSREQILQFRRAVKDTAHTPARLIVDLIYGSGLRVSEPLDLRIKDVLWSEGHLVIRAAKGGKDRRVPIPASCVEPLRRQIERARTVWDFDRRNSPGIGVPLPSRLAMKYPKAAVSWQWFWVFPAPGYCRDPLHSALVRFRILQDSVQRIVHEASVTVGLGHLITPHVLRHAYATHSREPIENLRQLMGHASIETTAGYRHTVVDLASNPLDDLLKAEPQHANPVNIASPGHFPQRESQQAEVGQQRSAESIADAAAVPANYRLDLTRTRVRWKGRNLLRTAIPS